jgi:hypothetical protein
VVMARSKSIGKATRRPKPSLSASSTAQYRDEHLGNAAHVSAFR